MGSGKKNLVWAAVAVLAAVSVLAILKESGLLEPGAGRQNRGGPPRPASATLSVKVAGPDGAPVAGAALTVKADPEDRRARTDTSGKAVFKGLPTGKATLLAEAVSFAREVRSIELRPGDVAVELSLVEGLKLEGQVVDERGTAVSTARIELRDPTRSEIPWVAVSGPQGEFNFDTLVKGSYSLDLTAELHERTVIQPIVVPADEPLRVVAARTAAITGRVLSRADQKPAAGAAISLAGSGVWPPKETVSDADGAFRISDLPGGVYELRASLGELVSERAEGIWIEAGSQVAVDLWLVAGLAIKGRVFDAEKELALEGAEIAVSEESLCFSALTAVSGPDGLFEVQGLRSLDGRPHRVSIRMQGYVTLVGQQLFPSDERHPFPLTRGATITGTVVDEAGTPVSGSFVELLGKTASGGSTWSGAGHTIPGPGQVGGGPQSAPLFSPADNLGVTEGAVPPIPIRPPAPFASDSFTGFQARPAGSLTDREGRFRIEGIAPGTVSLLARKTGYAYGMSAKRPVALGEEIGGLSITLARGGSIEGSVSDEQGFPVARVVVELRSEQDGLPLATVSSDDGSFAFANVLGDSIVTAYPVALPPSSAKVTVLSGQSARVKLVLQGRAIALEGRVFDPAGDPLQGASVQVKALSTSSPVRAVARSVADGTFGVPGLPDPPYDVLVEHPDYLSKEIRGYTSYKEKLVVRLQEGISLSGSVMDGWNQKPVANAAVTLSPRGPGETLRTRSDTEGRFLFRKVFPGYHRVSVEKKGFLPESRRVRVEPESRHRRAAELAVFTLSAGGSISGEVVDRLGAPVQGASVAVGDPPNWKDAVQTDAEGRFSRSLIVPGLTSVSARHPTAGKAKAARRARVHPLQDTPGILIRLPDLGSARK